MKGSMLKVFNHVSLDKTYELMASYWPRITRERMIRRSPKA